MGRRAWTALAGALLAASACNPGKNAFQLGLPQTRVPLTLASVEPRFGYLDALLLGSGWELRTFVPASEACGRVFGGELPIVWSSEGPYGTFLAGEDRCSAVGMGSLREWRAKQPRGGGALSVIPSGRAEYRRVYEDEDVVFLRGRFPLTGYVGFAGMGDAIAVVPRSAECERPAASESATLEFFPGGRNVLTLASGDGRCNIVGLVRPLTEGDLAP